jgi:hypothetical protein
MGTGLDRQIEPSTLGDMRARGVRSLLVACLRCNHEMIIKADHWLSHAPLSWLGTMIESRPRKSGREDRWSFCLTAGTLCLSDREIR